MKKLVVAVLSGMALVLLLIGQPARGQTGTSTTPTPTGTTTALPDAAGLIAQMQAAVITKGSAHISVNATVGVPNGGQQAKVVEAADVSSKKKLAHVVANTNTPAGFLGNPSSKATNQRQEILDNKRLEATRTGSKAWSCVKHKSLDPTTYDLTLGLTTAHSPQTVAADTINGVSVWHITASEDDPSSNTTGTADYYISQSDATLVRQIVDATSSSNGLSLTVSLTADYSKYGEAVKVKLPTACGHPKSQPLARRASTASLINLLPGGASFLL